jgi:flagellar assembly protein FliH
MEKVIRASRLTLGRTVLAAQGASAAAPVVRSVEAAPRAPSVDPQALRRSIEEKVREELGEQMRLKLEEQREQARKEGHAKGLAEGRAAAQEQAAQAQAELRAKADKLLAALQQAHERALAAWKDDVGAVAFEAVCRVAGSQGASREFVQGIVDNVCREARVHAQASVRMHPRDVQLLAGEGSTLTLPSGVNLQLVADDTVALGGCILDTEAGRFDGSLDTQLRRLHAALNGGVVA